MFIQIKEKITYKVFTDSNINRCITKLLNRLSNIFQFNDLVTYSNEIHIYIINYNFGYINLHFDNNFKTCKLEIKTKFLSSNQISKIEYEISKYNKGEIKW